MKIIGKRKLDTSPAAADALQRTVHDLRKKKGIAPTGVYRFKSFTEADEWMNQSLLNHLPEYQRSQT